MVGVPRGNVDVPQENSFDIEVVEPVKKAMESALEQATSEEDAKQKILDALPANRSFLGPLVMYTGDADHHQAQAIVQTLDDSRSPVNIEASFAH